MEKLAARLELPAGVFPVAGLCVGYLAQARQARIGLPPAVTVPTSRYDDGDPPAQVEGSGPWESLLPGPRRAPADMPGGGPDALTPVSP